VEVPLRTRILLVVDDEEATRHASIVAGNLAHLLDGELVVCRARTIRPSRAGPIESEPTGLAHELVNEIAQAYERQGIRVAARLVSTSYGQPVASIVSAAADYSVSYIVVGDTRRARWRRRLAERSPHQLIASSPIPVITVPVAATKRWRSMRPGRHPSPQANSP